MQMGQSRRLKICRQIIINITKKQDCGKLKPKRRRMNFQTQQQKESSEVDAPNNTPAVKLTRLPFLETHVMELEKSKCSVQLTEDCTQMSLCFKQQNNNSERPDCTSDSRTTIASDASQMESSFNESPSPSEHIPTEGTPEWQSDNETYREDIGNDSPVFLWQGGSDGEDLNEESRSLDFRAVSSEDRLFVCPVTLKKLMAGSAQALTGEDDELFETSVVLCRQSLSLVYSTIDENYTEGTLQLLSDLLQPGYYPPKDITSHLLRGILLDPKCSYHLCVQAFNLLMRTQRHHMADKTTIPWDWELLTSVMSSQRHQCEVVRMLLEYIVQTLEDDFQAKSCTSALHHSIAKATLSCDQQFPRVRDVIKWLFSAIIKSTELEESKEATRERNEQIRMVSIFQRMLSLALEVDRSPALNSAKLSQELFDMLISNMPLRAHRMLLLDSLQSKLLRCKLLEYLLDYSCPLKISLPMSLSLLLHFLKNCTLAPDPTDGDDRWQRWEELVHLLWMLLLSYNKAMKGYLCRSFAEQKGSVGTSVYKPDDMVWKPAVREAVEAFLSRSQADIGQALPLHVEESLTYLQDHLLDVCQC
uniref:SUMO-interacting motif-containing protein 1 n=1 Tax=Amphiprion ocellaris TaxID=80972 RepID=A0AAQ5X1P0_AMPOC